MIAARAWPSMPPPGRARVEGCGLPRVPVDDYDYRGFAALGDDVVILDWDTACHREDLHTFAAAAREMPGVPLVGPCRIYHDGPYPLRVPVWNAKRFLPGLVSLRYVETGEPSCHLFGFGMTYLPAALIGEFMAANPGHIMDDTSFSGWYHKAYAVEVPVCWQVSPVHLHYDVPEGGRL